MRLATRFIRNPGAGLAAFGRAETVWSRRRRPSHAGAQCFRDVRETSVE
jgi:hypothetical protein